MKVFLQLILFFIPWRTRRRILTLCFGWRIEPSAYIGCSLILAKQMTMGRHARIGHLNIIKRLDHVTIGDAALIGNLNWISASPMGDECHFAGEMSRQTTLELAAHAAISNRHIVDCTNRVTIGEFSIVGGWRSQILTHSIDFESSLQTSLPVQIGRYCFVGTGSIVLKGTTLPDYSVLAAGSVLSKRGLLDAALYSGVPAQFVRATDRNQAFFRRTDGYVR